MEGEKMSSPRTGPKLQKNLSWSFPLSLDFLASSIVNSVFKLLSTASVQLLNEVPDLTKWNTFIVTQTQNKNKPVVAHRMRTYTYINQNYAVCKK